MMSKIARVCLLIVLGASAVNALYASHMYNFDSPDYAMVRGSNGRSRFVRVMDRPDHELAFVRGANGRSRLVPIYDQPDRPDIVMSIPGIYDAPSPVRNSSPSSRQLHNVGRKKRHALLMPVGPFMHPLLTNPAAAMTLQARAGVFGGPFGHPFLPLGRGLLGPGPLWRGLHGPGPLGRGHFGRGPLGRGPFGPGFLGRGPMMSPFGGRHMGPMGHMSPMGPSSPMAPTSPISPPPLVSPQPPGPLSK